MTIVSFDFELDKDKIFIGYQFVIISEFCVSSRTSSSDQEEILTGLGVHMYNVQYRVDEHQESDHGQYGARTMRGEINLRCNIKFQSSPSHGQFLQHL